MIHTASRPGRVFLLLTMALAALFFVVTKAQAAPPYPIQTLAEATSESLREVSIGSDAEGNQVAAWNASPGPGENVIMAAVRPAGGSWGAPQAVSTLEESRTPMVAVNASGEAVLVWDQNISNWTVMASRLDIGPGAASSTWSTPIPISPGESERPQVAIDAQGVATAAWRQQVDPKTWGTAVASDSGGSWSSPEVLSGFDNTAVRAPSLAVNAAGDAAVAWELDTGQEILVSTRTAGGTWSAREKVATTTESGAVLSAASVGISSTAESTLAWKFRANGAATASVLTASKPAGGSWSAQQTLSSSASINPILTLKVNPAGEALAAWLPSATAVDVASRDAAGSWSAPTEVPGLPGEPVVSAVSAALDPYGNATIVGDEYNGSTSNYQAWISTRDAGGSWSPSEQLTADTEEVSEPAVIATDSYGDLVIAWSAAIPSGPRFVKAVYIEKSAKLTVSKAGSGSGTVTGDSGRIDCGASCEALYRLGAQVELTAKADDGSEFTGWSGACDGTGTCTVTIDGAKTAVATFGPLKKPAPPVDPTTSKPSTSKPSQTSPSQTSPAQTGPLRLVKVKRDKAHGMGVTRFWVPAAGKLTVSGKGVKTRTVTTTTAGFRMVKLIPKGAYRARLRAHHRGFTVVRAKFRSASGEPPLTQKRRVRLVWHHG